MLLFSIFFVRPGFYHFEIDKNKEYIVDLENSTAFTFRDSYPHYPLTAKRGFLQSLSTNVIKEHVQYFSVSESPLILNSDYYQKFTQWILPSTLCRSHNFMHNFGYSFKYSIDSTKFTTSCLFFPQTDMKHYITLNSNSRENVFTAKFITDESLSRSGEEKSCINATVCSVLMTDPFFIRLSIPSNKPINLSVAITTLHYPLKPSACSAEVIMELEDAKTSNRTTWEKVNSPICKNISDEIAQVVELLIEVIGMFILTFIIFWIFGCINVRLLCTCNKQEMRFEGLKEDPHARIVDNPIDSVIMDEKDNSVETSPTDQLIIQIEEEPISRSSKEDQSITPL